LCSESGSHDYTINRREAKDELSLNVTKPNNEQYEIIKALYDDFSDELKLTSTFDLKVFIGEDQEKDFSLRRGLIESTGYGSHVFMSEGKFVKRQLPGQPEIIDQINTNVGWTHEYTE
jgi:hypothetical protein